MKFFIENNELDNSIQVIRRKIRTLMNGVVADSMKEKGLVYKQNFGVDLPHLRELAKKYTANHDLAQRLWALQIRETMIMATLIQPKDSFSESTAEEWLQSVTNIELAEQISMNLLSKLPYKNQFCLKLIKKDESWSRITGFTLSARLWSELEIEQAKELVRLAVENSESDNFYLYKAVSSSLSRLCRRDKEIMTYVQQQVKTFEHSDKLSQQYIVGEIANEISFLKF